MNFLKFPRAFSSGGMGVERYILGVTVRLKNCLTWGLLMYCLWALTCVVTLAREFMVCAQHIFGFVKLGGPIHQGMPKNFRLSYYEVPVDGVWNASGSLMPYQLASVLPSILPVAHILSRRMVTHEP